MSGGCSLIAFRAQCAKEATRPDPNLKPIDLIKMAQGFAYQACEHKEWMEPSFENTDLREGHIQQFIAHMIRQMPGYDDAPWHYEREPDAPEVARLNSNDGSVTLKYIVYKLCEHGARTIGEFQTRQAALKNRTSCLLCKSSVSVS